MKDIIKDLIKDTLKKNFKDVSFDYEQIEVNLCKNKNPSAETNTIACIISANELPIKIHSSNIMLLNIK